MLVIVGHSFGGLIVYSAVAQSLIEAAATKQGSIVPSFANLVLLVNPAFEAARYLPVFEQIKDNHGFVPNQPPVFVCVTASNDYATRYVVPARRELGHNRRVDAGMGSATGPVAHDGASRLDANTRTVGARSAATRLAPAHSPPSKSARPANLITSGGQPEVSSSRGALLKRLPTFPADNPFWVVSATPEVVDGHNGIFGDVFVGFVHDLVATHMARVGSLP